MKRKDTILQHTEYTKPRGKRCSIWRQGGEVVWLSRVIFFPIYKFWVDGLQKACKYSDHEGKVSLCY